MEKTRERPQSHEDREAQKLIKVVENRLASQEAAKKAETKRPLDENGKKQAAKATINPEPTSG